jgi:rhomboid protease GluP
VRGSFAGPRSATKFILGLCLVDFAMLVIMNGSLPIDLFGPPANRAALIGAGAVTGGLGQLQPWRLLSASFVHHGVLHLGFNMYALLSFGRAFEERYGGPRLLVVYALTGVAGFWLSGVLYGEGPILTAGASASLFGLIGVEIGGMVSRRDPATKETFLQYSFMAVALAVVFPVNNWAHLGGFVAGFPLGMLLSRERRDPGRDLLVGVGALVTAAVSVASILLSLATLYLYRQVS